MVDPVVEEAAAAPAPWLRPLVRGYTGSRHTGFTPGVHLGLPSPYLNVVIALDKPIHVAAMPDRAQPPGWFTDLVAGLQTGPAEIAHDGNGYTVSVDLTPPGARFLLGVPAAALASTVVGLEDVVGPVAHELAERLAGAPGWRDRFTVLDLALTRLADPGNEIDPLVAYAWHRIVDSGGTLRVGELATAAGLTRQHLTKRFTSEYGLTPKQLARVVRFERSHQVLRASERVRRRRPEHSRISLADVATRCGYYDQAHLAREWNALAGCPPSTWLATEELPFAAADQPEAFHPSKPARRP